MGFYRLASALPALAAAVALAGCVTVGPATSPTLPPTVAPTASPPPTAPPTTAPTAPSTLPPTEPPTAPPTAAPTAPPTTAPTAPPTAPPTDQPTPTPPPTAPPGGDVLDTTQQARYGSEDPLTSGFAEPHTVRVVSGGPIDASYLGGGCTGYAEPNPDYEFRFVSGSFDLLRIYFVADSPGDDATLIVNDSQANWLCNDDSYGTRNPTIDFRPPVSGWYDIWIGSYSSTDYISGTLHITELESSHP
jgi:hypothetical protein